MIVTKPQKPVKAIQPIMGIEATKPKPIKKPVHHRKFGSEISAPKPLPIPEFGTGGYVDAMRKQDHPTGSRTTTTLSTSSNNLTGCNIFNINACSWL